MTDGERDPAEFGPWPLGDRLKALRKKAGLSLRAVANAAGTTAATVDAMEKGQRVGPGGGVIPARNPDANNVIRVAEAVGLNAAEALRLAGNLAPVDVPTSRPTVGVRALAENISLLPEPFRQHIAAIVEEHLRAMGHLPSSDSEQVWHVEYEERPRKPQPPGSVEFVEHEEKPRSHRRAPKPVD